MTKIRKITLASIIILVIFLFLTSFVKIGGEIKNRYSFSVMLNTCNDSDLEKINKFIFLKRLNIQRLNSDKLDLIHKNNLKELAIMTTTNHEAYQNLNEFDKLKMFYSVGLDFKDFSYFSSMNKLEELYLGMGYIDNRILSSKDFEKLPVSIKKISINGLENTDDLDVSHLVNLESLDICYSSLTEININNPDLETVLLLDDNYLNEVHISENSQKIRRIGINNCPNLKLNVSDLEKIKSLERISDSDGILEESDIERLKSLGIEITS